MATPEPPPFRHYLHEWRKARGLTQEELAARAGLPKSVVSRYESGDRRIHLEVQFRLMAALEIQPGQFFSPPDAPDLNAMIARASPDDQRKLVNMVKGFLGEEDDS